LPPTEFASAALLMSAAIGPIALARAASVASDEASVMSVWTNVACAPIAVAVARPASPSISAMTTWKSLASRRAIDAPRPRPAPVTIATAFGSLSARSRAAW